MQALTEPVYGIMLAPKCLFSLSVMVPLTVLLPTSYHLSSRCESLNPRPEIPQFEIS